MRLVYAIMCNDIIVDSRTGNVSFIRIIEDVTVRRLPAVLQGAHISMCWESTEAVTVPMRLRFGVNRNEQCWQKDFQLALQPGHQKIHLQLDRLILQAEGAHLFLVEVAVKESWECLAALPVQVRLEQGQLVAE